MAYRICYILYTNQDISYIRYLIKYTRYLFCILHNIDIFILYQMSNMIYDILYIILDILYRLDILYSI